ncbi:MAG: serine/threonine-protein kinase [Prosthecobacter sp.]
MSDPRYEVRELIAKGGLGSVFRAWDTQEGRPVAIKRIQAEDVGGFGAAVDRMVREARLQSALCHPNIVAIHDTGVDQAGGYIVMELIQGDTLENAVRRKALSVGEFDSLVRQTLAGMSAAHQKGIVHLDLKPENLMLQPQPEAGGSFQVKILDFGLAKIHAPAQREHKPRPKGLFGSVYFMAPEQFEIAVVDARADIYALGCVFYYALTQKVPFEGDTSPQVIVAHRYHHLTPLAALRPDLPASLVQWVERLISRLPADRPASLEEALQGYVQAVAAPASK